MPKREFPFWIRSSRSRSRIAGTCFDSLLPANSSHSSQPTVKLNLHNIPQLIVIGRHGFMGNICDTILWLKSISTGKQFPAVEFTADTDIATAGWVCLCSTERAEVVITQLTPDEQRGYAVGGSKYLALERRVNAALSRSDLKHPWLVQVEQPVSSIAAGRSFPEFRKTYQKPGLLFRDIYADGGVAEEVSRISRSEFEAQGGHVLVLHRDLVGASG